MKVAALYKTELKVEERSVPAIGDDEILLKVSACGLCGTDILKIKNGSAPAGSVLGHEIAGVVVKVGAGVTLFQEGERVVVAHHVPCGQCHFCKHGNESMCAQFKQTNLDPGGFAEFVRIPTGHVKQTAFRIPATLSNEEALFMEPLACCVRAMRRSQLLPGDTVIVIGLGSIGLMLCQLLLSEKMKVIASDLMSERVELAKKLGALPLDTWSTTAPQPADMVLFTGGSPKLLQDSFQWIRNGGKFHLFSHLSGKPILTTFNDFYHRELTLLSTYSSTPADLRRALALLAAHAVTPRSFGWEGFDLSGIAEAVQRTVGRQTIKAIIYSNSLKTR